MRAKLHWLWAIFILAIPARTQCVSLKEASFLVSDRYTAIAEYKNYLVLVNEFGLVYRDIQQPGAAPVGKQAVPGEITAIYNHNNQLFLVAKNEGVYIFADPSETNIEELQAFETPFPQQIAFYSIPGIQAAHIEDNRIFAALPDQVALYRFEGKSNITQLDTWPSVQNKILANGKLLFLHRTNGPVTILPYTENGFGERDIPFNLDGQAEFYGIYLQGSSLIVDGPPGVSWVQFNDAGAIDASGYLHENANQNIVQGLGVSQNMLALRFSNRIEISTKNEGSNFTNNGSIALSFSQLGYTKIFPIGSQIHLINTEPRNRDWSMRSYSVGSSVGLVGEVEAQFGDIAGAATLQDILYVATEGKIYQATGQSQEEASLELVFDFGEPLVRLEGSDQFMIATTISTQSPTTRVTWLEANPAGGLQAIHEEEFTGAVEEVALMSGQVSLLQHLRKTDGEHYTIHVITPNDGAWVRRQYEEVHPFQTETPIRNLQISELGVTHHNGQEIVVHPDLNNLNRIEQYDLSSQAPITTLASQQGHFWVESDLGLQVFQPENGALNLKGKYDHWYNMIRLPNNLLLARSSKDRLPSRFHLLSLEDSGIVQSQVAFSMSGNPLLVNQTSTSIITVEKNAFNQFEMNCPPQNFNYLIPFAAGLEMELNTLGDAGDLITLSIFREDGQIIGVQSLSPDLLEQFNGSQLLQWLFDFNRDEAPFSFVLSSSRPLNPIISGQANSTETSRFAYAVPPWGTSELFVPHIPQNLATWNTELFIRNFNESDDTAIILAPPSGDGIVQPVETGGTQIINVAENSFNSSAPWARVLSENLETRLSGFSLYQDVFDKQAAAVPMSSTGSDFLILPNLIGSNRDGWWTGLVLANTNSQQVIIRALGYDEGGQILLDRQVEIPANKSMVVVGESWLDGLRKREQVKWVAISAERPIIGMALFGDSVTSRLAGLPLTSEFGQELQFTGIRSSEQWQTELQITNIGNDRGLLVFDAFDGEGRKIAFETREIGVKGLHDEAVASLFSSLSSSQRADIQSIRVTCNTLITGFMFRMFDEANSLEAASPFIPQ